MSAARGCDAAPRILLQLMERSGCSMSLLGLCFAALGQQASSSNFGMLHLELTKPLG